jgi:hypothetical protein
VDSDYAWVKPSILVAIFVPILVSPYPNPDLRHDPCLQIGDMRSVG